MRYNGHELDVRQTSENEWTVHIWTKGIHSTNEYKGSATGSSKEEAIENAKRLTYPH